MAEIKYTQKQFYNDVIKAMSDNPNAVAMAERKLAQLENKTSKVDTKKAERHDSIMSAIKAVLYRNGKMQCGAISKAVSVDMDEEISPNTVNAMLRKMLPPDEKNPNGSGEVVRTMEKKIAYFSLAD